MAMRPLGAAGSVPAATSEPPRWRQPPVGPRVASAHPSTSRDHLLGRTQSASASWTSVDLSAPGQDVAYNQPSSPPPPRRGLRALMRGALRAAGCRTAHDIVDDMQKYENALAQELRALHEGPRGEHAFFQSAVRINRRMSALLKLGRYLDSTMGRLVVDDAAQGRAMRVNIDAITDAAAQRLQGEYKLAKKMWRDDFNAQVSAVQKGVMPRAVLEREIARLDGLVDESLLHTPQQQEALKRKTAKLRQNAGLRSSAHLMRLL